ncbi:MAG: PIN domain-containing protein [Actinobacteria bacterium]|nr:PIN domain-containing protein [Actinomycetota bacterium]
MPPGRFFLDTNIFVYSFDDSAPVKRAVAQELVERALTTRQGLISYQVIQEFLNVAGTRFAVPLSVEDRRTYLDRVLAPLCEVFAGPGLFARALDVQERYGFAFYDALIFAGALEAACAVLYTEDLQAGQRIGAMEIVDPFARL